jgi:hypothetical protein
MKITFTTLLFILILGSLTVAAQENDIPLNEPQFVNGNPDSNLNEDRPLLFEPDSKSTKRDSTQLKVTNHKAKTEQRPSSSKNDDALSFNFLYYIIQKFKISDLIDN